MDTWEYKTITVMLAYYGHLEACLNEYGKQGWELVQIVDNKYEYKAIFKKKINI